MCYLSGLQQDSGAAALQTPLPVQRLHKHSLEAAVVPAELPALSTHDHQHYGRVSVRGMDVTQDFMEEY